jgi:hypothetical protein
VAIACHRTSLGRVPERNENPIIAVMLGAHGPRGLRVELLRQP